MNYSQNNEQEIIINLFKGKRDGTFLDIGANDGKTFSNTFALANDYGWTGILVEPSPKAFEKIFESYGKDRFELQKTLDLYNNAIGKYNGKMKFYESGTLINKGDVALVSSAVPSELKRWESLNMPFEEIEVSVLDFETLVGSSNYKTFDLLSLDIEGMELDVLPQIDFKALKIQVAVIEFNGKNEKAYNDIMFPQGFKLVSKNPENLIYTIFK